MIPILSGCIHTSFLASIAFQFTFFMQSLKMLSTSRIVKLERRKRDGCFWPDFQRRVGDMNRKADIKVLLDEVTRQYNKIIAGYEAALHNQSLDLRVPVKNLMENLRSALDYMAHDIYEACCQPSRAVKGISDPKRIYFPYGKDLNAFRSSIRSFLPGLESGSKAVFDLLLSIQPFTCGDSWLFDLCSILNDKKHDRLTEQIRTETQTHTVQGPNGSVSIQVNPNVEIISTPNSMEIFGVPAEFRADGIYTAPSPLLKHTRITWVGFTFAGTSVNVLELLNKAVSGVTRFSESLNKLI